MTTIKKFAIFYPLLGMALDNKGYLFEYRTKKVGKRNHLYCRQISPTFTNDYLELYRFKRKDKIFVFIIRKDEKHRQLVFHNWPFGQPIFAMLLDKAVMVAERWIKNGMIDCSNINLVTFSLKDEQYVPKITTIKTPIKSPILSDHIIFNDGVLSLNNHHYFLEESNNDVCLRAITEYDARNIRAIAASKLQGIGWIRVPYYQKYGNI